MNGWSRTFRKVMVYQEKLICWFLPGKVCTNRIFGELFFKVMLDNFNDSLSMPWYSLGVVES